jgi:hypothetical protein
VSDGSGRGAIPPEILSELRASVRALRGELAQRFGVRDSSAREGDERLTSSPSARTSRDPRASASVFWRAWPMAARAARGCRRRSCTKPCARVSIPGAADVSAEVDELASTSAT